MVVENNEDNVIAKMKKKILREKLLVKGYI